MGAQQGKTLNIVDGGSPMGNSFLENNWMYIALALAAFVYYKTSKPIPPIPGHAVAGGGLYAQRQHNEDESSDDE